jgi:hypothetical protein
LSDYTQTPEYHSWKQFDKALLKLGYKRKFEVHEHYAYYVNDENKKVSIQKKNRLDLGYVHKQLDWIGISHEAFINLYQK